MYDPEMTALEMSMPLRAGLADRLAEKRSELGTSGPQAPDTVQVTVEPAKEPAVTGGWAPGATATVRIGLPARWHDHVFAYDLYDLHPHTVIIDATARDGTLGVLATVDWDVDVSGDRWAAFPIIVWSDAQWDKDVLSLRTPRSRNMQDQLYLEAWYDPTVNG